MDNLIDEVIQRLKKRQNSSVAVSFNQQLNPPDEQVFINHEKVILENTSINLIYDLYLMNKNNPWVSCCYKESDTENVSFSRLINKWLTLSPE